MDSRIFIKLYTLYSSKAFYNHFLLSIKNKLFHNDNLFIYSNQSINCFHKVAVRSNFRLYYINNRKNKSNKNIEISLVNYKWETR